MPLYHLHKTSDEASLIYAIWQITENENELIAPLSYGEEFIDWAHKHYNAPSRRLEWLAVRRLLHELGVDARLVMYHPSGRPYLRSDCNCHISISHTRGYAAVALHPDTPIGIDIEQKGDKVMRVRNKFASATEEAGIIAPAGNSTDVQKALLTLWSAKETIFKLIDLPGIDFAEHLHVHPFDIAEQGEFTAHESFTKDMYNFRIHYHNFPDFIFTYGFVI